MRILQVNIQKLTKATVHLFSYLNNFPDTLVDFDGTGDSGSVYLIVHPFNVYIAE